MIAEYKEILYKYIARYQEELNHIFTNSWNGIADRGETLQLKDFLLEENVGVKYINNQINQLPNKYFSIKFNAIYSHGSPQVTFDFNREPIKRELADLLVILRINEVKSKSETLYSSSFLSQWKLNQRDNRNPGQAYLYDSADRFFMPIWIAGHDEASRERIFDNRANTLNFFYLNDKNFLKRPAGGGSFSFSQLLIDLLNFQYGLAFNSEIWSNNPIENPSHWDNLMNDLINKVGRTKKIKGAVQSKLIEYFISNKPYYYHIDNEEVVNDTDTHEEKRFQSILILDINFDRTLKIEKLGF